MKYTTITAYDDNRAPIGVTDFRSKIDQGSEVWFFRESTGQVDVSLVYHQGVFAKNIGGKVSFPWGKGYREGGSKWASDLVAFVVVRLDRRLTAL
jgi:hypothetical protein